MIAALFATWDVSPLMVFGLRNFRTTPAYGLLLHPLIPLSSTDLATLPQLPPSAGSPLLELWAQIYGHEKINEEGKRGEGGFTRTSAEVIHESPGSQIKASLCINLKNPHMSCLTKSLYCWGGTDGEQSFDFFLFGERRSCWGSWRSHCPVSPPPPNHMAAHFSKKMKKVFFCRRVGEYVIFNQSRAAGRHLNNNMKIDESLPSLAAAHRKAITTTALLIIWTERRLLTHYVFLLHHHSPGK